MTTETSSGALRAAVIAAWIFIIVGVEISLCVVLGLLGPLDFLVDLVFWPLDGAQSVAAPETQLVAAILGGLLAGWGATLLLVLRHGVKEQGAEGWAWRAAMTGLLVWFAVDSAGSVAAGAWANVIGNLGFLALLGVPLWLMRRPRTETAIP